MNKIFFLLLLIHSVVFNIRAQYFESPRNVSTKAIILDGDTVPIFWLKEVKIFTPVTFKCKNEAIAWTRLVRNVKKVYPYSKLAGIKMKEYNEILRNVNSKRERSRIIRKLEKELFAEFEQDLRGLTISQGKILIKLIDRETRHTTYDIIKEYRGGIMAGFWQVAGSFFGYNLKEPYDPTGKDKDIEHICILIENGKI